jgi:hypothetical protein
MKIQCMLEQKKGTFWSFVNQFKDHVLLQDSKPIINVHPVQICDGSIESRLATQLLCYLHSINCISHRFHLNCRCYQLHYSDLSQYLRVWFIMRVGVQSSLCREREGLGCNIKYWTSRIICLFTKYQYIPHTSSWRTPRLLIFLN